MVILKDATQDRQGLVAATDRSEVELGVPHEAPRERSGAGCVYALCKLKSYVAVETKEKAVALEKYFKTGSGKAVALKRFL